MQDTADQPAITIEWDKTFGGKSYDDLSKAISTPDGGFLLAGTSSSDASGDKSDNSKGVSDYWLVKIDADGNKVWDKTIGGSSNDGLSSALLTPDGGYLLCGYSVSNASGDKSEDSKGDFDYWIVKVDAQGNKVWDKTIGGIDDESITSAISTPDGGYLLAGSSLSDASRDKSEDSKGNRDYWVVKIDADGNKVWDKTLGGGSIDIPGSILSTPDGGYLLAGYSISDISGDKSEGNRGQGLYDYWIVKIDGDGNKIWDKTIGGNDSDRLSRVTSTSDGGFLLAGTSYSPTSGDKSEDNRGLDDYWIVKIDGDGNKIWDKTIGGNHADRLSSATSTPDGGFLLAGTSSSHASGDKSEDSKGGYDYWVVKIDADGNKIWDKTIGGSNVDGLSNIISTPHGGYLLAGGSRSNASGDKSKNSKGISDYWIVKIKEQNISVTPVVTSFTLINAKTDQEIRELKGDGTFHLAEVGKDWLNIRANTSGGSIDNVKFQLQGPLNHIQTEETYPYALFGDYPTGDFKGREWLPGSYSLTATPFFKNEEGTALTLSFEVTDAFAISSFSLVDAKRNQAVGELSDGDVIDLASFNDHPLSIRAETEPMRIGKVSFALQGPVTHTQVEKEFPYALFGDYPTGNFKGLRWQSGTYTLTATPYALDSMGMSSTIHFTVIDIRVPAPEANSLRVEVYPVPTSGLINILYEGRGEEAQLLLLDFGGNILLSQPLRSQPVEQLNLSGFSKGIYYLKIVSAEGAQVFRVVKE